MTKYNLIYEYSCRFPYIAGIILIILVILSILIIKNYRDKLYLLIPVIIAIIIVGITYFNQLNTYFFMSKMINSESYKTVEGCVSNFRILPYNNRPDEFYINNIRFSYSEYDDYLNGYHNSSSNGGPINNNDIKVKINYFYDSKNNVNSIIKLQISDGECKGDTLNQNLL